MAATITIQSHGEHVHLTLDVGGMLALVTILLCGQNMIEGVEADEDLKAEMDEEARTMHHNTMESLKALGPVIPHLEHLLENLIERTDDDGQAEHPTRH